MENMCAGVLIVAFAAHGAFGAASGFFSPPSSSFCSINTHVLKRTLCRILV
jgi:hypothetical protein